MVKIHKVESGLMMPASNSGNSMSEKEMIAKFGDRLSISSFGHIDRYENARLFFEKKEGKFAKDAKYLQCKFRGNTWDVHDARFKDAEIIEMAKKDLKAACEMVFGLPWKFDILEYNITDKFGRVIEGKRGSFIVFTRPMTVEELEKKPNPAAQAAPKKQLKKSPPKAKAAEKKETTKPALQLIAAPAGVELSDDLPDVSSPDIVGETPVTIDESAAVEAATPSGVSV